MWAKRQFNRRFLQMMSHYLVEPTACTPDAGWEKGQVYRISGPTIMGYLRNNSIFTFGKADRAKTSATYREILNAMWLFNDKFERALSKLNEIKARQKG
jgi:hypothetical protein